MLEEIRSTNGFAVSNKAEFQGGQFVVGVELGLKLQEEDDRHNQKQQPGKPPSLCSNQSCDANGGDDITNRLTFNQVATPYLGDNSIYAVSAARDSTTTASAAVAISSAAGNGVSAAFAPSAVRPPLLQPFDISYPAAYPSLKSPGAVGGAGMAATTLGFFPFTAAQWKELQRQAMIFKYMMASVPVPPDLLFSINNNFSDPSALSSSWGKVGMFDIRWASNSKDAEPGRCKRTDGKKWRCSRDVAPNQKYCERHLNRGRPRSRKPVEIHADFSMNHHPSKISPAKKTRLGDNVQNSSINRSNLQTEINGSTSKASQSVGIGSAVPGFDRNHESKASSFEHVVSAPPYEQPRTLDWTIKDEGAAMAASEQQWQQLGLKNIGLATDGSFCNTNASIFQHHFEDGPLNLNSLVDFNPNKSNTDERNFCLFANSATPKGFIDAWSNHDDGVGNKSSVPSNAKVSPSLALSVAGRNLIDEEMCRIQMGLSVIDSDCSNGDGLKHQVSSWLSPPPWVPLNPGGPLAEVLRPRSTTMANSTNHPSCPDAGNGDLATPSVTAVSSPSGVLQRSLASFSDSSGNNSPICDTTKAKREVPFQWLS
ncbi:hypothetical protein Ancab_008990 [Ancistrocladus abbreviatus]